MTKEEIRNHLYSYIHQTYGNIDHDIRKQIKKFVIEHDQAESKSRPEKKVEYLRGKIGYYAHKARSMEQTERILGNVEALEWCSKWLIETDNIE